MIKITNRQGNVLIFIAIFLTIIWMIFHQFQREKDFKKNGIIVNAIITNVLYRYNSAPSFQYRFSYKNSEYIKENTTGLNTPNFFIGKNFPAIFSPSTGNSELLMTPEDFDKYNIPYPDSLQRVLQYRVN